MTGQTFTGFPLEGLQFFEKLAANNNRDWFKAHKQDFQAQVQRPAQAFVIALGQRLQTLSSAIRYDANLNGSGSIMRIYRDIRFSRDKTPYKTHLGIVFWEGEGKKTENPAFYFGLDPTGGKMYAGMSGFPKPMLEAYRQAVLDNSLGSELETVLAKLKTMQDYEVSEPHYKRMPRGFDKDHPRASLLLYNGLGVVSPQIDPAIISSPALIDVCFEHCQKMAPVQQWLVKVSPAG